MERFKIISKSGLQNQIEFSYQGKTFYYKLPADLELGTLSNTKLILLIKKVFI